MREHGGSVQQCCGRIERRKGRREEKIKTLDTQVLLLIAMNNMMDDYTGDLVEYSGEYKEDAGKRYQECFKILTAPS